MGADVNLVLVGYRGSGKSSVGAVLAGRLDYRFVDVDELIALRAGQSIAEIFASEGEAGFRRRERETCKSLEKTRRRVIALGGGAVTDPDVRVSVRKIGRVVWLRAPAAVLWARISRDPKSPRTRPDLTPEGGLTEVEEVLRQREPLYRSVAHHWVDTCPGSPETVAETIQTWFEANDASRG
jgi:shikimate kinase